MHSICSVVVAAAFALNFAGNAQATEVMILGTYHMANPGHDLHNLKADDVLVEKRQHELADISAALSKFKPTKVAVESSVDNGAPAKVAKYHDYLDGKLADSRNETVQIGFRLAKQMKLPEVWGIDVDGDFPYEEVKKFADNGHPQLARQLDEMGADVERMLKGLSDTLKDGTIAQGLRYMNEPRRIADDNSKFYRSMLLYGAGAEQPGAALLSAWQARNNAICARLVQLAKPDDRIVVVYGSGHAYLLRQCVSEMPGYKLIEANAYLPK
jgi:Family of unknown function (DUF5694)